MAVHAFIFNTLVGRGRWLSVSSRLTGLYGEFQFPKATQLKLFQTKKQRVKQTRLQEKKKSLLLFPKHAKYFLDWLSCK